MNIDVGGRRAVVIFVVGICYRHLRLYTYAVMSNHTHVVLYVNKDMAEIWSKEEVVRRWHQLYQGTLTSQKHQRGDRLSKGEFISLEETVTFTASVYMASVG